MKQDETTSPETSAKQAQKDRKRAYGIAWRAANKEKKRAYDAERFSDAANREKKRAYAADRRADPVLKERDRAALAARMETPEGRAKLQEYQAKRTATPEGKARKNAHCAKGRNKPGAKEKQRAYMAEWLRTPEGRAAHKAGSTKRRAIKRGASIGDVKAIKAWVKSWRHLPLVTCRWCEAQIRPDDAHVDHVIPLKKGGPHTLSNLCIACAKCNLSKGSKLPEEWASFRS